MTDDVEVEGRCELITGMLVQLPPRTRREKYEERVKTEPSYLADFHRL